MGFRRGVSVALAVMVCLTAVNLSARTYFTVGGRATVKATDFGLASFSASTVFTASYRDPLSGKKESGIKLTVVGTPGTTAVLEWTTPVALYTEKMLSGVLASEKLSADPPLVNDLTLDSLMADGSAYKVTTIVANPFVRHLTKLFTGSQGSCSVEAICLGSVKPKVYLECVTSAGKPKYVSCRVTEYARAASTQLSTFFIAIPQPPAGATATGYYLLKNKVGICVAQEDIDMQATYTAEVAKAQAACLDNRQYSAASRSLHAVNNFDTDLVWDTSHERVLAISWKYATTFDTTYSPDSPANWVANLVPGQTYTDYRTPMFATAAPDMKRIAWRLKLDMLDIRDASLKTAQLLGMPPYVAPDEQGGGENKYNCVLEMWVKPEHLIRPCPDPEITDHESQVDFTYAQYTGLTISSDYKNWFNFKLAKSYVNASNDPWPFTGFGYAYDWGYNLNESNFGPSEFVIIGPAEYGWQTNPDKNPNALGSGQYIVNRKVKTLDYFAEEFTAYSSSGN